MRFIAPHHRAALAATVLLACAGTSTTTSTPSPPVNTTTLSFAANQVVELALSSIKDGKRDQLLHDYFPKVLPLVAEYGGRMLAGFGIVDARGPIQAQAGVLFQWPSVGEFLRIAKDPRVQALLPIRADALSYINEANFFTIAADTVVSIDRERDYELVGFSGGSVPQAGRDGVLLVMRPTTEVVGSFRPDVLVLREAHAAGDAAPAAEVRLRIRFMP